VLYKATAHVAAWDAGQLPSWQQCSKKARTSQTQPCALDGLPWLATYLGCAPASSIVACTCAPLHPAARHSVCKRIGTCFDGCSVLTDVATMVIAMQLTVSARRHVNRLGLLCGRKQCVVLGIMHGCLNQRGSRAAVHVWQFFLLCTGEASSSV
jgi:hypothetical protein